MKIKHLPLALALAMACGAANAAQLKLSGGTAIEHDSDMGDQPVLNLNAALHPDDTPLMLRATVLEGMQAGGPQTQEQDAGVGLTETAGPWTAEVGAEVGHTRMADAGQAASVDHFAGTFRGVYAMSSDVALTAIAKLGRANGFAGDLYAATGLGVRVAHVDAGTVSVDAMAVRDGALPRRALLGVSYILAF